LQRLPGGRVRALFLKSFTAQSEPVGGPAPLLVHLEPGQPFLTVRGAAVRLQQPARRAGVPLLLRQRERCRRVLFEKQRFAGRRSRTPGEDGVWNGVGARLLYFEAESLIEAEARPKKGTSAEPSVADQAQVNSFAVAP
jgi:hypothetical protein